MATKVPTDGKTRFTDLSDEPVDRLLSPIRGHEDKPLLPLTETIASISGLFTDIEDYVFVALHNCQHPADGLDQQESATIHLYTMEFDGGPSLYLILNQSLRAENREELKPWFTFLKLFLTALYKLPSQSKTVWRGVKNVDLSKKYKKGTKFAWWGVSSCTTDIQVLESDQFLGKHGQRTLFSIECIHGKSITNHSYFKNAEKEIILMPGSYFEVIGQLNPAPELHIIQLKEIIPPVTLVKPPFSKPINTDSPPVMAKSPKISQPTSQTTKQNTAVTAVSKKLFLKSNTRWKQNGITVAGGNGRGNQSYQLHCPGGILIEDDQTIYIADSLNHRIVRWKYHATNGQIVADGDQMNQLNVPTDVIIDHQNNSFIIADLNNRRVARWSRQNKTDGQTIVADIDCRGLTMDKNGSLYVSDCIKDEVRRWKRAQTKGIIVAGGNGQGDQLNQLNCPSHVFVDEDETLYISDLNNHRVIKWMKDAKEGIVGAGGNGEGKSLKQLSHPEGLVVDQLGHIYVVDCSNDRVMRWCNDMKEGSVVVGGNGYGEKSNQLKGPTGLAFDLEGNLYVADRSNHRVQKFEID